MQMLLSFCKMHKRNSDQLLKLFFDDREGKSCQKSLLILQKLFQDLQRTIFSTRHFHLSN